MDNTRKKNALEEQYTRLLLEFIDHKAVKGPRTYGFEYEFISAIPLTLERMEELYNFLPEYGFYFNQEYFRHSSGLHLTFEPGGQIEYHSPPMFANDNDTVHRFLDLIAEINSSIHRKLGIEYLPTGYLSGRKNAPLCLNTKRYKNLHARLAQCGLRGLEMMKGTASIHLHVGIRDLTELAPLFSCLNKMSVMDEFKMGQDRRDIWDHTDSTRCGLPYAIQNKSTPQQAADALVRFALQAYDISDNIPFYRTKNRSFDAFLYHMTTIFTDVRFNGKGPSVELRTLDSLPFSEFTQRWERFITLLENNSALSG